MSTFQPLLTAVGVPWVAVGAALLGVLVSYLCLWMERTAKKQLRQARVRWRLAAETGAVSGLVAAGALPWAFSPVALDAPDVVQRLLLYRLLPLAVLMATGAYSGWRIASVLRWRGSPPWRKGEVLTGVGVLVTAAVLGCGTLAVQLRG